MLWVSGQIKRLLASIEVLVVAGHPSKELRCRSPRESARKGTEDTNRS